MLHPANRLTLIDAMRSPAGFRFESAAAVTFTLDLRALLAAPAALALTANRGNTGAAAGGETYEPIELIHALRSHAGKLTVFNQAGEIALPESRRIFAFLERTVVPVTAPRGGIVHPKVWVLRYESVESVESARANDASGHREQRLRVLVASRNLTFDTSWDTILRLDETAGGVGAGLAPIGELLEELLSRSDAAAGGRLAIGGHSQRVSSLAEALHEAKFQLPAGVRSLRAHVLGSSRATAIQPGEDGDGHPPTPLLRESDRSLIISPFVSDDFFAGVHPERIDEMVSRRESLDGLTQASLARVGRVQAFDDGNLVTPHNDDARRSPGDPGRPLIGLHAKVFAFEKDSQATLFVGSANATGAAFRNNLEVLVELVGSTGALGIDRLCGGTDDEPGLRHLFHDYRPSEDGTNASDGSKSVDRLRRAIAKLQITGQVAVCPGLNDTSNTGTSSDKWSVTYRSSRPIPQREGVKIVCWPLASAPNRRPVTAGSPLHERFKTSLENLSGFLAFELTAGDGAQSSFIIPVPLDGVPGERDRLLLRSLIGNAERFFRYLLALLEDDPGEIGLLEAVETISDPTDKTDPTEPASLPVLEKLLRTIRRDPAKLAGLHPLVTDLAGDGILPPGFIEMWEMIQDVAAAEAVRP